MSDGLRLLPEKELMDLAVRILQGQQTPQSDIANLARALKNRFKRFGMARKLLWLARGDSARVTERNKASRWLRKLAQQHALCTYKDADLPAYVRFDRALKILRAEDLRDLADPAAIISQETLGIAGAIYKAQWEAFGQRASLYQSFACYERAWTQGLGDDGYTGINTAFLLDLIAFAVESEAKAMGVAVSEAENLRARARGVRKKLADELVLKLEGLAKENEPAALSPEQQEAWKDRLYWLLVTLGEALAGQGLNDGQRLALARDYYGRARDLQRPDWMIESTARQLAALLRLAHPNDDNTSEATERTVMRSLVGDSAPGVESAFLGKIGLALSGGGFRASLFHIGVLARLAEIDMLRHIEYLSCVSGGSIIGAYYYLEIRRLLQTKTDDELTRQDYIDIVKRIEVEFLAGVQKNLRMEALSDFATNLDHNILSGVLPTERVAELYETLLYTRTGCKPDPGDPGFFLSELFVCPVIEEDGTRKQHTNFRPKDDNWRRRNKIPILVLNATTLNTGHNWQFTATWMGEPPSTVNNEADGNQRLRRMYYSEAPSNSKVNYRKFRLGFAVGASAGVPSLLSPLELPGLYEGMNIRLVDGGVHDNQGVSSLLDQSCTVLLVSDASGQLADTTAGASGIANVGLRADEICQERVRVAEYQDLESRVRSGLLRSLMFIHLRKDLDSPPKDWIGCPLPDKASEEAKPAADSGPLTSYGINREIQKRIARIRTDLDSFHQTEAWALMTSGYRMVEFFLPPSLRQAAEQPLPAAPWKFLTAAKAMASPAPSQEFLDLLDRSGQRLFKIWQMNPALQRHLKRLKIAGSVVGLALLTCLIWLGIRWPLAALLVPISGILLLLILRLTKQRSLTRIALAFFLAWISRLHLRRYDPLYLEAGMWKESY
jgi:predicted acylesterase/phospholipase RssA